MFIKSLVKVFQQGQVQIIVTTGTDLFHSNMKRRYKLIKCVAQEQARNTGFYSVFYSNVHLHF